MMRAINRARTERVENEVRCAMRKIEEECARNDWHYPHNGGRLTQREVCRCAAISINALQGPTHRFTLRAAVNAWLVEINRRLTQGVRARRRQATDLMATMKKQASLLAAQCQRAHVEIAELRSRVAQLTTENQELRRQKSGKGTMAR